MTTHRKRVLTYLAALVVFGGLFRMMTDDQKVATQLPEPQVASSQLAKSSLEALKKPDSLATAVKRARSSRRVVAMQRPQDHRRP
jgi:hypothetical protein